MRVLILILVFLAVIWELPILLVTWTSLIVAVIVTVVFERLLVFFVKSQSARVTLALIIAFALMEAWDAWRIFYCADLAKRLTKDAYETVSYCEPLFSWEMANLNSENS